MGWGKLTKAIGDSKPNKSSKTSFGTQGRNEKTSTSTPEPKRSIDDYDYNPEDHSNKGSLRRNKLKDEANTIYNDPKLSEKERSFQLQRMIDQEKIHQDKFKPDTQRKQHLRDQVLNKNNNEKLNQSFDKRTDGNWYTKN